MSVTWFFSVVSQGHQDHEFVIKSNDVVRYQVYLHEYSEEWHHCTQNELVRNGNGMSESQPWRTKILHRLTKIFCEFKLLYGSSTNVSSRACELGWVGGGYNITQSITSNILQIIRSF